MDLSRLEWLELQSKSKPYQVKIVDKEKIEKISTTKTPREIKTTIVEVWKQNLPNYIDPNTGLPYDPFRENSERGIRLTKLRKLRAVLP